MYNILFSIPVHERLDVIIDQILNIKYYNPNSAIVLHISKKFNFSMSSIDYAQFIEIVKNIGDVYINPNRMDTNKNTIMQTHISNYAYIKDIINFEYICLIASNQLFIKEGFYEYANNFDCGLDLYYHNRNTKMNTAKSAYLDNQLLKYLYKNDTKLVVSSQVEGTFYRTKIFYKIYNEIINNFVLDSLDIGYPMEEIYFPTVISILNHKENIKVAKKGYITYIPWKRKYTLRITIKSIENIIRHDNHYYSVKRVDRHLNNYIRTYIREKLSNGNYYYENIGYKDRSLTQLEYKLLEYKCIIDDSIGILNKYISKIRRG